MLSKWTSLIVMHACFLLLGASSLALGEENISAEPQTPTSPERVQINSIGGRAMATHPYVINVIPGEQISLKADIIQAGNACPHPEGCPENRAAEEFHWSANDRADDECSARRPETCRDRTAFQPNGDEMIFHIPYAMGRDITIQVGHENLYSSDVIVLHNAHYGSVATRSKNPPPGYYEETQPETPVYPTLAPSGIDEPYVGPYYPFNYWWGPYPYPYRWAGWGWGWGGPGWSVGIGFGWGPMWGWGWGWGWHGGWYGYHPGIYGYYHPGWWHPGYNLAYGARVWRPAPYALQPHFAQQRVGQPLAYRPAGNYGGARPAPVNRSFRRRRGRR